MRSRGTLILAGVLAVVLAAGAIAAFSLSRQVKGSAEQVARDYLDAWREGDLDDMAELVDDPPEDFVAQHRALTKGLLVYSIKIKADPLVREPGGKSAHRQFEVERNLGGRVTWRFRATLRVALAGRSWKVRWTPATLHPELRGPVGWKLTRADAAPATFLDRDGRPLDEAGPLEPYLLALSERFGDSGEDTRGWAVDITEQGVREPRRLALLGTESTEEIRTTLDAKTQRAAEQAIAGKDAAIVAVRPSDGGILAVADGLSGRNAFLGAYPPGSTFKTVTAAALLADGMSSGSGVDCPGTVVTAQRTIRNADGLALGGTSLQNAFAHSCNTTFSALAVDRLGDGLADAAETFGFNGPLATGIAAVRGSFPDPGDGAELAEAAIGQGRVQASPLMMATVAAAVADGTWHSPRLVDAERIRGNGEKPQPSHDVPGASALRAMMRAVVTDGTAKGAGLPSGTAGKTGTAEIGADAAHAWFIGYRDEMAFAVFVRGGGSGSDAAAPLAARFLQNL